MWSREGPVAKSGYAIGHGPISPKPNQEIWVNNYGLPERPDWRKMIYEDGKLSCRNWHFKSAEDCLFQALSSGAGKQTAVRRCGFSSGIPATMLTR